MLAKHNTSATAYSVRDTSILGDLRIRLKNAGVEEIFPAIDNFVLLSPADNSRLAVKDNDTTKLSITWQSTFGANNYEWLADLPGGDFSNPVVSIPSDNNGTEAQLTLTSAAVSALLGSLGINERDSVNIIWKVRANDTLNNETLLANNPFNLKLVRMLAIGIDNKSFLGNFKVYPNPTTEILTVENYLSEVMEYSIKDVNGKLIKNGRIYSASSINVEKVNPGVYFIELRTKTQNTYLKFIKK